MMNSLKKPLQNFVLRTNRIWPLKQIYLLIYKYSLKYIIRELSKFPEVISIYLGGSGTREIVPGSSDWDLVVIIKEMSPEEGFSFLDRFYKKIARPRKIFPFFIHIKIMDEIEFSMYTNTRPLKNLYGKKPIKKFNGLKDLHTYYYLYFDFLHFTREVYKPKDTNYIRPQVKLLGDLISSINCFEKISPEEKNLINKLLKKLDLVKRSNYFVEKPEGFLFDSWVDVTILLSQTLDENQNRDLILKNKKLDLKFSLTKHNYAQETQEYVVEKVKPFANDLYKDLKEYIDCILLSSRPNCNYAYLLYVIIKDNIELEDMRSILEIAIKKYRDSRDKFSLYTYYLYSIPLIIPKSMFLYYHKRPFLLGPVYETLYLLKHGKILSGNNLVEDLKSIEKSYTIFNDTVTMFLGVPLCTNMMDKMLHTISIKNSQKIPMSVYMDAICGGIPSRRLFFDKGIVTTTPRETFEEFLNNYSDEDETKWYKSIYEKYCSLYENPLIYKYINLEECFRFMKHNTNDIYRLMEKMLSQS